MTDLGYAAAGRDYGAEDVALSRRLERDFTVAMASPRQAGDLLDLVDVTLVRNSGPVQADPDSYHRFRAAALATDARVYNPLTGRADMAGKQYLLDLWEAGYPVLPTVGSPAEVGRLPRAERYVVKPRWGADSRGLRVLTASQLLGEPVHGEVLVQPHVDIAAELSFYVVDGELVYALATRDPSRRWDLVPHEPSPSERRLVRRFVEWNTLEYGLQRVDLLRDRADRLLLVELEDLNPFLSLDRALPADRDRLGDALVAALRELLAR